VASRNDQSELLQEGEELLMGAFEQARASGHPQWRQLRSAVLKNRLLSATGRTFDEARWGVEKFAEFLALFPDIVSVDSPRARR
jgi:hypothetical protein